MHRRDNDAFPDADSVWRWTVIVHEDGTGKMRLRTPCCQDQLVVGSDCFQTGVVDLHCWGCAGRYDVVFKGDLTHGAAGWKLR